MRWMVQQPSTPPLNKQLLLRQRDRRTDRRANLIWADFSLDSKVVAALLPYPGKIERVRGGGRDGGKSIHFSAVSCEPSRQAFKQKTRQFPWTPPPIHHSTNKGHPSTRLLLSLSLHPSSPPSTFQNSIAQIKIKPAQFQWTMMTINNNEKKSPKNTQ